MPGLSPSQWLDAPSAHRIKRRRIDPSASVQLDTPSSSADVGDEGSAASTRQTTPDSNPALLPREGRPELCFGMLADLPISMPKHQEEVAGLLSETWAAAQILNRNVLEEASARSIGTLSVRDRDLLNPLMHDKELVIHASIRYASSQQSRSSRGRPQPTLCVVLYGPRDQLRQIGGYLRKCKQYLQHPVRCKLDVEYRNPHMLSSYDDGFCTTFEHCAGSQGNDLSDYTCSADVLVDFENVESDEADSPQALSTELFQHQKQALAFMLRREQGWAWHSSTKDIWRVEQDLYGGRCFVNNISDEKTTTPPPVFRGGIIADTMGLGKSLTAIAMIASDQNTLSLAQSHSLLHCPVPTTLLVVKAPLVQSWLAQLQMHTKAGQLRWKVHHGHTKLISTDDIALYDVVVTTYHTLLAESKKSAKASSPIYYAHWHRVILDEAHDIRHPRSATCKAICALEATQRWAITGTPIQNSLVDLLSLFQFLRLPISTRPVSWKAFIQELIDKFGQEEGAQRLRQLVRCVMLRRSLDSVVDRLPGRRDTVCYLDFSPEESELYQRLKSRAKDNPAEAGGMPNSCATMQMFTRCRMVCNLGTLWQARGDEECSAPDQAWTQESAQARFNTLVASGSVACNVCLLSADTPGCGDGTHRPVIFSCQWLVCGACRTGTDCCNCPSDTASQEKGHAGHEVSVLSSLQHPAALCADLDKLPTKLNALMIDLRAHRDEEKSVVLSFWTSTLDLVETALKREAVACIRFDGTVPSKTRDKSLAAFKTDPAIRVALLSVSCGAVGLDITAASRVYLLEPQWNPSVEQQALARVYRIGQTRPVTTIRYIMRNTLEEHVLKVQQEKQKFSDLVLSESNASDRNQRAELLQSML